MNKNHDNTINAELSAFEELTRNASSFMVSSMLNAAAEIDIFTPIIEQDNSLSAKEIAEKTAMDKHGVEVLLDALAGNGFLLKAKDKYSVVEKYLTLLDSSNPRSAIPILRHYACIQRSWAKLSWAVQSGTMVERSSSFLGKEQDNISFIMGMNSVAVQYTDSFVKTMKKGGILDFSSNNPHILDVGGASGTYAEAFLEIFPDSHVSIFDLPVGIEQAAKRFAESPYKNRIELFAGDFTKDELPNNQDFAWLSAIIHQFDRNESIALYRKIHSALKPNGVLAIRDFFMSDDHTSPRTGTLFGINMLVQTPKGRVYSFEETKQDLIQAGFRDIQYALPAETMFSVVTARK